jgi:rhodanese-related sulfurtransferase
LRDLGYEDVAFYEGGIDAWADYGGPVETSRS